MRMSSVRFWLEAPNKEDSTSVRLNVTRRLLPLKHYYRGVQHKIRPTECRIIHPSCRGWAMATNAVMVLVVA